MIMISRKEGQSINILDENNKVIATIQVKPQRRKNQVSLGLSISEELRVIREETRDQYQVTV